MAGSVPQPVETDRVAPLESVSRALTVLQLIDEAGRPVTASEVSKASGLPLPITLRLLRSLTALHHLEQDDRRYWIADGSLGLSWSYLSALNLESVLRPALTLTAQRLRICGYFSVLSLPYVHHADRVRPEFWVTFTATRIARAPAHVASSGHVLLAELTDEEFDAYTSTYPLTAYTELSLTDPSALRDRLHLVKEQGWAINEGEHVSGLCGVAVPVRNAEGAVIGAFSTATNALQTPPETLHGPVKEGLLEAAAMAHASYVALAARAG